MTEKVRDDGEERDAVSPGKAAGSHLCCLIYCPGRRPSTRSAGTGGLSSACRVLRSQLGTWSDAVPHVRGTADHQQLSSRRFGRICRTGQAYRQQQHCTSGPEAVGAQGSSLPPWTRSVLGCEQSGNEVYVLFPVKELKCKQPR